MENKRAVVFSGGGAKGGYQIGVWKALREIGFTPDIVTGTSVGALNGALMAMGEYEKAIAIWENMSMATVFEQFTGESDEAMRNRDKMFSKVIKEAIFSGGADYSPLQRLVQGMMDEEKLRTSPIEFGLVTTQFSPFQAVELFKEDIPEGQAADYILASAACFPMMKSYKIGDSKFVDGGYSDNIPVRMALQKGATEIVAVNIGSMGKAQPVESGGALIHYISNKRPFNNGQPGSVMMFEKNLSLENIRQGYLDALKEFGRLDGYYYAFQENEISKAAILEPAMNKKYKSVFSAMPSVSALEASARKNVREFIAEVQSSPFSTVSGAMVCLEQAAEIFGLDPRRIYTFNELREQTAGRFFEELSSQSAEEMVKFAKVLDRGLSLELMHAAFRGIDKKALTVYAAQILMQSEINRPRMLRLWIIAALMPEVFCAAMFCFAEVETSK